MLFIIINKHYIPANLSEVQCYCCLHRVVIFYRSNCGISCGFGCGHSNLDGKIFQVNGAYMSMEIAVDRTRSRWK